MRKHLIIKIYGSVQGVGFRAFAHKMAKQLGVTGFIRNEIDGSVFIEAEGEEGNLSRFMNWCRKGPPSAHVDRVECVSKPDTSEFSAFTIKW